jgi:hypothetical protein
MEIIKKKIFQIMTTGTTSGCTENCFVIIPDLSVVYNFKIGLTSDIKDLGFFDASDIPVTYPYGNNNAIPIGLDNLM